MIDKAQLDAGPKISRELAERLDRLEPDQTVHLIVLLGALEGKKRNSGRQSPAERQKAVEAVQQSARKVLRELDEILAHFGGQRQSARPDALGSVAVEVTPEGAYALSAAPWVKAILEDQPIYVAP